MEQNECLICKGKGENVRNTCEICRSRLDTNCWIFCIFCLCVNKHPYREISGITHGYSCSGCLKDNGHLKDEV